MEYDYPRGLVQLGLQRIGLVEFRDSRFYGNKGATTFKLYLPTRSLKDQRERKVQISHGKARKRISRNIGRLTL